MYLTIVDTAQIQSYVFGSNRLRENIGASYLVAMATGKWAFEAVKEAVKNHNICNDLTIDDNKHIESEDIDAEVIYSGGGNYVVVFKNFEGVKKFTRKLSQTVLTNAPGLQLVITTQKFKWDNLTEAIKKTFAEMSKQKQARVPSQPLLGLGVTLMCQSTGLPANDVAEKGKSTTEYPASDEILAKLDVAESANKRLLDSLNPNEEIFKNDFNRFPFDLDDLGGSKGEHSFIAVVHADGNGLGEKFLNLTNSHAGKPREYINAIRELSREVEKRSLSALQKTISLLLRHIKHNAIHHPCKDLQDFKITLSRNKDKGEGYLPLRPIVFGGDDVTFVCDGRIGLSLAIHYLRYFEEEMKDLPGGGVTACAGVAVVKTHFPFSRAYALSENLIRSAKDKRREKKTQSSWIDWHYALSGLFGSIEEIRRREYTVSEGNLHLRPVDLADSDLNCWSVIEKGLKEFQESDRWKERRNKVKALREALREGKDAVKYFINKYNEGKALPDVHSSYQSLNENGWSGRQCGYFDAIELVDSYLPLIAKEESNELPT